MKLIRIPLITLAALAVAMTTWTTSSFHSAAMQGQSTALERGYRTGYSDGYNAGHRDLADQAARDYRSKEEYQRADRNFNAVWGPIEDYRDGYQQGFEAGYEAASDRRPFDSSIPSGLARKGTDDSATTTNNSNPNTGTTNTVTSSPVDVPRDTILLVELQSNLSTDATQQGDKFEARVMDPRELEGAIVEGRVTRVRRAGKVKGTSELQLSFESIRLSDGRSAAFPADVIEIVDMGNRDSAGTVDSEGGVKGRDSTKDDISKVGASTGIGAILGAIFGGGKGAAIGAAIGGSVGTAGVLTSRGKDLRLPSGQQLRIRTSTETRIR